MRSTITVTLFIILLDTTIPLNGLTIFVSLTLSLYTSTVLLALSLWLCALFFFSFLFLSGAPPQRREEGKNCVVLAPFLCFYM